MTLIETGEELHRPSTAVPAAASSDQHQKQRRRTAGAGATRQRRAWDDGGGGTSAGAAPIEEPPSVWSPFSSSNQDCGSLRRKLVHQTPQHVATLTVPSPSPSSSSSSSSKPTNESFALVPPLLYQEEYVIQAMASSSSSGGGGKMAFWMLSNKRILSGKNSTCRRTLHPDFVLDTGANAPLVDLALFFDDEQEEGAAAAASDPKNSIGDKQQQRQQYPSVLALSTLGEVFCISIVKNSQQQQHQHQSSLRSPTIAVTTTTGSTNTETKPHSSSSSTNPSGSLCMTVEVLLSWNTGRAGATCLTTAPCSSLSHDDVNTKQHQHHQRQILVGYQSGHLEAWKIICVNNGLDETAFMTSCEIQAENLWTGVFDHHFPIHSLLHVPVARSQDKNRGPPTMSNNSTTTTTSTGNDDHNGEAAQRSINGYIEDSYLALTLHPPTRLSTPSYMEIINLTAVEQQAIHHMAAKECATDGVVNTMVSLENHWVLPLPGEEIRDPSTIVMRRGAAAAAAASGVSRGQRAKNKASSAAANSLPGTISWIPSNSTNRLCSLVGGTSTENNGRPSFVVALADGTIGLLSATKVEAAIHAAQQSSSGSDNDSDENNNTNGSHSRLDWGISKPMDQLLLSYPCIGLGKVDLLSIPHAVCALRGGTVYLIPLADTVENSDDHDMSSSSPPPTPPPLTVITYPDDIDTDTAMQHLQDFVAGMVIVSDKDKDSSNARLPLLFFSWPGGVIDVYSCQLLRSDAQVDRVALAELLANGSVESLKSLLSCLGDEHGGDSRADLPHALLVAMARREVEGLNGKVLTLNDLSSEKLKSFRSILLRFAGQESGGATLE